MKLKERKLGNFLVGSLKITSSRLSRERNRKIGLNIEERKKKKHGKRKVKQTLLKSCSNESHGHAFEVNENWASLTRGRKSIDARSYTHIYRVVQSWRNLEIEVVAVSNTKTFLPAKRNLEETCPILSIFQGEL